MKSIVVDESLSTTTTRVVFQTQSTHFHFNKTEKNLQLVISLSLLHYQKENLGQAESNDIQAILYLYTDAMMRGLTVEQPKKPTGNRSGTHLSTA